MIVRDKMSRPIWSVPNQCVLDGAASVCSRSSLEQGVRHDPVADHGAHDPESKDRRADQEGL